LTMSLSWLLLALAAAVSARDIGYTELFTSHNLSVDYCIEQPVPNLLHGSSFIIPSLGQFEMGNTSFRGLLDGFGKLNRFTFANGSICFKSKMMDTGFYNASLSAGKVGPSLLFAETDPPRGYGAMTNMQGPNDNVFVNTYQMADVFRAVTDSETSLEFDPHTLAMIGKTKWSDQDDEIPAPIMFTSGSAHQLPHPNMTQCIVNVLPKGDMMGWFGGEVEVYQICPEAPTDRVVLNSYKMGYRPYFHSWGLSQNYAIFIHMHFSMSVTSVAEGKPLGQAFEPKDSGKPTEIAVMPLYGGDAVMFEYPDELYFTHTINAYENETSITYDLIKFEENPFAGAGVDLLFYRNVTARNSMNYELRGKAVRMVLHMAGELKGTMSLSPITAAPKFVEFPAINNAYQARDYCFFYAVEWFHDTKIFSDMAIVKHDVCSGEVQYWYMEDHFPSEPQFVATPGSDAEDDGVIVFTVLEEGSRSSLMIVNATTMSSISKVPTSTPIGFTTHGQIYHGL